MALTVTILPSDVLSPFVVLRVVFLIEILSLWICISTRLHILHFWLFLLKYDGIRFLDPILQLYGGQKFVHELFCRWLFQIRFVSFFGGKHAEIVVKAGLGQLVF